MDRVSNLRTARLPEGTAVAPSEGVGTPERCEAPATSRTHPRPYALPAVGKSATRLVFKERFKERLCGNDGPGLHAEHSRAQDLAIYQIVVDAAMLEDSLDAPRLKHALVRLYRLHRREQPALSLPQFIHRLLADRQGAAAAQQTASLEDPLRQGAPQQTSTQHASMLASSEQIAPNIWPEDAILSLVLGTRHLTNANCSRTDLEAIKNVLHFSKQRLDPAIMANLARHGGVTHFISLIAKNAGQLVSRLFFEAQIVPLDKRPRARCANTAYLMEWAIHHGSVEFVNEFVLGGVNLHMNPEQGIRLLHRILTTPEAGVDVIKKFVDAGMDLVRLRFARDTTALQFAVQGSTPAVIVYLLSLRCQRRTRLDVNGKGVGGADALRLAANNAEHGGAIARLLIERGANVEFDPVTSSHPAHCMIAADNDAGLQAILDGVSRRQRQRLINTRYPGPDVELIIYAALYGTAPMVQMIFAAEPGSRQRLRPNVRPMFEVAVAAVTKGEDGIRSVTRLIANVPDAMLRELDQEFGFYEQAASLPCAPQVLDCLVAHNACAVEAGAEPVFDIPESYDPRSTLLGLTLMALGRDARLRLMASFSAAGEAGSVAAAAAAGAAAATAAVASIAAGATGAAAPGATGSEQSDTFDDEGSAAMMGNALAGLNEQIAETRSLLQARNVRTESDVNRVMIDLTQRVAQTLSNLPGGAASGPIQIAVSAARRAAASASSVTDSSANSEAPRSRP